MPGNGVDSASVPNSAEVALAVSQGHSWWGFYIKGVGNTDPLHAWEPGEEAVFNGHAIQPVPIVVPDPSGSDPILTAQQAFAACAMYGLRPNVSVCYNGEHITVTGPVWLPIPGYSGSVGPQSAIQYGIGSMGTVQVDLNISADDWPGSKGIVCDLEHGDVYDSAWYAAFQNTIASLGRVVPTVPAKPMPATVKALSSSSCNRGIAGWLDVFITGSDGNIYHYWWDTHQWNGYDITNQQ